MSTTSDPFQVNLSRSTPSFDRDVYNSVTTLVHQLQPHQLEELQSLFPHQSFELTENYPASGLPYLESLTNATVYHTIQRILQQEPSLVCVSGEVPQIVQQYPDLVWNIEVAGDNFESYQTISSCTHHLRDSCECAGIPDAFLFVHSLYFYSTVDVARALYNSNHRYAYSVHHPFKGACGNLGFGEVKFEVSHGRVSTTRFPSFERSDLNWLYTSSRIEFFQSAPNTDEKLHLYEISRDKVVWTLTWRIVFDSKDIQIVRFDLVEGYVDNRPQLEEPTLSSLSRGHLAYGQLKSKTNKQHIEQVWDQIAVYKDGAGRSVYTLDQFKAHLVSEDQDSVLDALQKLETEHPKVFPSSL